MSVLAELLHPHGVHQFLDHTWGRAAAFIPGAPERFARLGLSLAALEAAVRDPETLLAMSVRFVGSDDEVHDPPADLAVYSLRDAEHTLCVDRVERTFRALSDYCDELKASLGHCGPLHMSCYASPAGLGFGMHLDCQSSFVLQLEGTKRWRYSAHPAVEWPPVVVTGPRVISELRERYPWIQLEYPDAQTRLRFDERVLTPGDVLYLPAGTWHEAAAVGDHSLALTLACTPMSAADLVDDVVRGLLSHRIEWRSSLPPVPAGVGPADRLPDAVRLFLDARLDELRAALQPLRAEDLYETWLYHVTALDEPPRASGDPRPSVAASDLLARADGRPVRWTVSEDGLSLYVLGRRVDLEPGALPLLRALQERAPVRADALAQAAEEHAWEDVVPLLDLLVAEGALRVVEDGS